MTLKETNGWGEYKRLVLHEIKQLRKEGIQREERLCTSFEKLEKSFGKVETKIESNAKDITTLRIKAARLGALSGTIGAVLIEVIKAIAST